MHFIWDNGNELCFIISLVVTFIVYGFLFFTFVKVVKRKVAYGILSAFFVLAVVTLIFDLIYAFIVVNTIFAAFLSAIFFSNLGDIRGFVAAPFKIKKAKTVATKVEKIFDRNALYAEIKDTVSILSASKTGAIMTFERQTSLMEITKNGIPVNAPVSKELLQTIFFNGTRMHDGAVVIHGNTILYAAVFYTPSTKPFAVKYGSRHRAAIGISEVSDAVTVVVSEETGRISIAVNGTLESVSLDKFIRVFQNYMEN